MPSPEKLLITSGEPAGIGPDLCVMLAQAPAPVSLTVVGDGNVLQQRAKQLGLALTLIEEDDRSNARDAGTLRLIHVDTPDAVTCGEVSPANAPYVLRTLDIAVQRCLAGDYAGMVTAPVHKGVINDHGIPFTGHTEYLAGLAGADHVVMLLIAGTLRVALATTHLPVAKVSEHITGAGLSMTLRTLHDGLRQQLHIDSPRIMVCGLNPHAGEDGHLGTEDRDIIAPVLAAMREQGMSITGPVPADTAFIPKRLENTDVVLAMYHDQGLPVLKYVGFGDAVNMTLGLPFVRTSVDHGTALELAGTGNADASSLRRAVAIAAAAVAAPAKP